MVNHQVSVVVLLDQTRGVSSNQIAGTCALHFFLNLPGCERLMRQLVVIAVSIRVVNLLPQAQT
jgi:hypothetical protein